MDISSYSRYTDYITHICKLGNLTGFKSNRSYTDILEHVNQDQGKQYLSYIYEKSNITSDEIVSFCKLNDSLGNPSIVEFNSRIKASPTSLRYILHAHLILNHMISLNLSSIDLIEIGGGYGGLCLALDYFSSKYNIKIDSYTIIDLESALNLQNLYLSTINPSIRVKYINASTYGASMSNNNLFLVSNYCFSEISKEYQMKYIKILFPKVSHGFMAWNAIPTFDFGFKMLEEKEYPLTGQYNKYLYF